MASAVDKEQTVAERNRDHFDNIASKYDSADWTKYLTRRFSEEMQAQADWVGVEWAQPGKPGHEVRMLDFACGPGMASNAYFDRVTAVRGIDISPKMVAEYNRRAQDQGHSPEQMRAVAGDVFASPADQSIADAEFFEFDFAVISGALHHMPDAGLTLEKLAQRLKKGGTVLVLDFLPGPDGDDYAFAHGHGHGQAHGHGHDHGHGHGHGHMHGNGHANSQQDSTGSAPVVEMKDGPGEAEYQSAIKTIVKHSFSKDEMRSLLAAAGFTDIDFKEVAETFQFGGDSGAKGMQRRVFLCRARKA